MESDLPFRSMITATGLAEVWTHSHDTDKLNQFGWRCTNKESSYGNSTLVGNWNEERFDVKRMKIPKRLPSQFEHYFDTTYKSEIHGKSPGVPEPLKRLKAPASHAFPGHQPDLDSPKLKDIYNSYETTSRAAYMDPKTKREPLKTASAK